MIFTMDIGNTNIKTALFDGKEMRAYWRISTNKMYSSDEYGMLITNLFAHEGFSTANCDGIIISSVVPTCLFRCPENRLEPSAGEMCDGRRRNTGHHDRR